MSVPDLLSLFRASMDEDEDVIEENFQTANMIHKLKQTKENKMKRKDAVKKRKRNYKNIEEFETLMNDKNTTETHNKAVSEHETAVDPENNANIETFESDDYTNDDYVEDPEQSKIDGVWRIDQHIEKIFDNATSGPRTLARIFCKAFTGGKATKEDEDIVHDYIMWILTAFISLYVVYNWYFVMFYAPKNEIELIHVSRDYFESRKESNGMYKVLLYIFDIAIWFPETLDKLMTNYVPDGMNKFFNGSTKFILLYYFFIYFNYNAVSWIKDQLVSLFTGGSSLFWLFEICVLILFLLSFDLDLMEKLKYLAIPYYLIRLIIVAIISVPVGLIFSSLYLIFNSFFAKWWYSSKTLWSSIDIAVGKDKSPLEELTTCDLDEETSFVVYLIRSLFNFATEYKFHLIWATLFGMFAYSAVFMYQTLSDAKSVFPNLSFRDTMMLYNVMLMISIGSIIFARIRKRKLSNLDI